MVVLFFTAYYFDHIGVLSMAIVNLAAWLGLAVTPMEILRENDFSNPILPFFAFQNLKIESVMTLATERNTETHQGTQLLHLKCPESSQVIVKSGSFVHPIHQPPSNTSNVLIASR